MHDESGMKTFLGLPFDLELPLRLEILVVHYFLYFLLQKFDFSAHDDTYFIVHVYDTLQRYWNNVSEYQTFPLQAYSMRDKNNFIFSLFLPN